MDPASMAALSLGTAVAGGVTSAVGGIEGGEASAAASGYQAQIARINAGIARINRDQTLTAGAQRAEATGIAGRQTMGRIITTQAASGLDLSSPSLAAVRSGQQGAISKDISTIYDNTARAAYGYEVKAHSDETSALMLERQGAEAKRAAMMKGLSTLLGTASTVAGRWMDAKRTGVFGDDSTISGESWTET